MSIRCWLGFHKWTEFTPWRVARVWDKTFTPRMDLGAMRMRSCKRCDKQDFEYIHTGDLGRG
jgi:hypothetical protein